MFETQGGTRNRTRDLPKKGSAFITSSDHWTVCVRIRRGSYDKQLEQFQLVSAASICLPDPARMHGRVTPKAEQVRGDPASKQSVHVPDAFVA